MFISIGFGNLISAERIIAVLNFDSAPVKRLAHVAKEQGRLIDASCGRKTQSVFVTDSDHVVLSALSAESVMNKVMKS